MPNTYAASSGSAACTALVRRCGLISSRAWVSASTFCTAPPITIPAASGWFPQDDILSDPFSPSSVIHLIDESEISMPDAFGNKNCGVGNHRSKRSEMREGVAIAIHRFYPVRDNLDIVILLKTIFGGSF